MRLLYRKGKLSAETRNKCENTQQQLRGRRKKLKQVRLFGGEEPAVSLRLELAKAQIIAKEVETLIKPLCDKLEIVGSIRRQKPIVGDVDFVVVATDSCWGKIVQVLRKATVICAGKSVIKIHYPCESSLFQVDFYRATPHTFGIQELIRTGSADHNMWLAGCAISKGFRLKYSEGLLKDEVAVAGETEESVFTTLGFQNPEPQLREVIDGKPVWLKT